MLSIPFALSVPLSALHALREKIEFVWVFYSNGLVVCISTVHFSYIENTDTYLQ